MPTASLTEISRLSVSERIQLAEDIWDTIASRPEELSLTESQTQELDSRLADIEANPNAGASWQAVRQRIQGKV
jgi:putative addiction module component (TIGR02574 family)